MYIPLSDDKHQFVRDSSLWSLFAVTTYRSCISYAIIFGNDIVAAFA